MTTILDARGISVSYGRQAVLHGANLTAQQGEIVALLGPNGAGKTTLIKAVLGLVASHGSIKTTKNIGILLDDGGLLPGLTGRQHLHAVALFHGKTGTDQALQLVDMAYAADQKISTYSLGMKRRIALAAALIAQPTLLLLDEPANGLDPEGIRWLNHFLRDYAAQGNAVVLCTHHLAEAEAISTATTMIRAGRTVYQGPTTDDSTQPSIYVPSASLPWHCPLPQLLPLSLRGFWVLQPPKSCLNPSRRKAPSSSFRHLTSLDLHNQAASRVPTSWPACWGYSWWPPTTATGPSPGKFSTAGDGGGSTFSGPWVLLPQEQRR